MNKPSLKSKIIPILVGAVAFILAYIGTQQLFKTDVESELKEATVTINRKLPMDLDELTRLDSTSYIGKTRIMYYYTLVTSLKSQVQIDTVNKYVRPGIISNVIENPEMKFYRDNDITLEYIYFDRDGEKVHTITVTPDLYK